MASLDWFIVIGYLLFALGIGFYFSKRASKNIQEYFLTGRNMSWWILGTSMVATTFASDTPLSITGWVREKGIWQNWFWWSIGISHILSTFLFARLWRRAKVLTDNELIELRYSGRKAALLRGFKATYYSTIGNFIVLGWVIGAMSNIICIILDMPDTFVLSIFGGIEISSSVLSILLCCIIALIYSTVAGLWGVIFTDLIQFVLAMTGSIALMWFALEEVGGVNQLIEGVQSSRHYMESGGATLSLFPSINTEQGLLSFFNSPAAGVITMLLMIWWSSSGADGGGYIIQRMMSAKNEKHALGATLWFSVCHYALRTWPWIVVALCSIILFPDITGQSNSENTYAMVMHNVLPPGWKGVLIASFLAAFMSTIDTHLNWGASYLVNDIYKRFVNRQGSEKHYVMVSKSTSVFLMVFGGIIAYFLPSIAEAWIFLWAMGSGIGLVLILRWFWWRINAWSEISALISSIVLTLLIYFTPLNEIILEGLGVESLSIQHKLLLIVPISILVWVTTTFLTKPESKEVLNRFYDRVQPGGSWGPIAKEIGMYRGLLSRWIFFQWGLGVVALYSLSFGIGYLFLLKIQWGILFFGVFLLSGLLLLLMTIISNKDKRLNKTEAGFD